MSLIKTIGTNPLRSLEVGERIALQPLNLPKEDPDGKYCARCTGPLNGDSYKVWTGPEEDMMDYMIHEFFNEFEEMEKFKDRFKEGCRGCHDYTIKIEDICRPIIFDLFLRGRAISVKK